MAVFSLWNLLNIEYWILNILNGSSVANRILLFDLRFMFGVLYRKIIFCIAKLNYYSSNLVRLYYQ